MSFKKKDEELAFNRLYSRFKVQIFFAKRSAITHYGQERYGCTVAQIKFGHIKQVTLDRERGLQDCLDRIALCEKLYGPYQVALIYDRRKDLRLKDGTMQQGKEIGKYILGQLAEWQQDIFSSPLEKRILTTVVHANGSWALKPIENPNAIDFKSEVLKAVNPSTAKSISNNKNQNTK